MKKRVIKKHFHKIAKKSIKDNSYLYKKYGVYNLFIEELNRYLDFILNTNCVKQEVHFIGNIKLFINNCVEDTEDFIDKKNSTVNLKVRKVESYKFASKVDDLAIFQDRDSLELEFKYNPKYAKQDMLSTKKLIGYVKKSDLLEFLSRIER